MNIKTIFLILLAFLVAEKKSIGQQEKHKTNYNIKDYFLLIPDTLLKTENGFIGLKQRKCALKYKTEEELWKNNCFWKISVLDYRNAYIKLSSTGDGAGTDVEITYFVKKDKSRIIAVNIIYWDMAKTYSNLNFYVFSNNKWKNITKKVLPEIKTSNFTNSENLAKIKNTNNFFLYELPQYGKNIKVSIDNGITEELTENKIISKKESDKIINSSKTRTLIWNDGKFYLDN